MKEESGKENKLNSSKFEYELYNDKDNVVERIIHVKKEKNNWKVLVNKEVVISLDSKGLEKSEIKFLDSVNGMIFLIEKFRKYNLSLEEIITELRKKCK